MIDGFNIIDTILFSESLDVIKERLVAARKDYFSPNDRIIIHQDVEDKYPYVDASGKKLIEIQKIINSVDISNCFILLVTANPDVEHEIQFITKFYSVDPTPINFLILANKKYHKEIKKYTDTSCEKLWNHLYVGTDCNVNPCCVANHRFPIGNLNNNHLHDIINSSTANQIRDWMKQGYRSIACDTCYQNEDIDLPSHRLPLNVNDQPVDITSIDIRLNNICNFKCRMCSEYFSSSLQEETVKLYGKNARLGVEQNSLIHIVKKEKEEIFSKLEPYITNKIEKIYFAGGEPLIMPEHYLILDKLININNLDLSISYNTNLSKLTYKNINVIDYWNQFSDVTVGASIDASDRVAEYVRHGTIWKDLVQNIISIKENAPNVHLKITSTVSFLTAENLINLQKSWIDKNMFNVDSLTISTLTSPNYLSLATLPTNHKNRLSKIIQQHIDYLAGTNLATQWKSTLSFMMNNDHTYMLDEFRNRTRVLDDHRGESFIEIFPNLKDLYEL